MLPSVIGGVGGCWESLDLVGGADDLRRPDQSLDAMQSPRQIDSASRWKAPRQNVIGCRTISRTSFWSSTISVRTPSRVSHHRSGSKL